MFATALLYNVKSGCPRLFTFSRLGREQIVVSTWKRKIQITLNVIKIKENIDVVVHVIENDLKVKQPLSSDEDLTFTFT